jgi:hypothetical protein
VILEFADFADFAALIVVVTVIVLYWQLPARDAWFAGRRLALATAAFGMLAAFGSLISIVGYGFYVSGQSNPEGVVGHVGRELASAIIATVAAVAAYQLTWRIDEQMVAAADQPDDS